MQPLFPEIQSWSHTPWHCLGWDRAAMDYDADTVVDVISCNTHHRDIRRLQMRVASAAVDPSDCVTTSHCKLSTVLSATPNWLTDSAHPSSYWARRINFRRGTQRHCSAELKRGKPFGECCKTCLCSAPNALLAHRCQCRCFKRVCRDALQYVALVRVTST